jgi:hypothetical protein
VLPVDLLDESGDREDHPSEKYHFPHRLADGSAETFFGGFKRL